MILSPSSTTLRVSPAPPARPTSPRDGAFHDHDLHAGIDRVALARDVGPSWSVGVSESGMWSAALSTNPAAKSTRRTKRSPAHASRSPGRGLGGRGGVDGVVGVARVRRVRGVAPVLVGVLGRGLLAAATPLVSGHARERGLDVTAAALSRSGGVEESKSTMKSIIASERRQGEGRTR